MKKCLLKLLVLLLTSAPAVAQTVTGRVTNSADGTGLPGVSVLVKGTTNGTTTDTDGRYSISAQDPTNTVLVFSFIGFASQEVALNNRSAVDVSLNEDVTQLGEVVVTALGIEKETKSLTYSVQQVGGEQLTVARDPNLMNSLNGKVAGIQINRANGPGGSTRVTLRGNKSLVSNQPLYVVDGVPMLSTTLPQPSDVWGQSAGSGSSARDAGDAISNINPDDIESISVLKGASAAALYGSQAANGVILITTKKGKAGVSKIDFSSNLTTEQVLLQPELQFKYGQTAPGARDSWGGVVNAPNHVKDFFQNGTTWTNSLSFSGGTDKAQTYVSYSNTTNKGIMPTSKFDRHTLNFRETAKFLNDKLNVDASVNLIHQNAHNRPVSGIYNNPLTGLYLMPRGLDFQNFKDNYQYFSPTRNMYLQNWWNINFDNGLPGEDDQQNPYWSLYKNQRDDRRDRAFGSLTLKYNLTDWLTVQGRGRFDKSFDKYELKSAAGTQGVFAAPNGRYTLDQEFNTQLYADLLLMANKDLSDNLNISATLGSSIQDFKANDRLFIDTSPSDDHGLNLPNVFSVWNISPKAERVTQSLNRKQIQGVFASAQLGYNDYLFFDLTARNDWSSALAYTSTMKKGFFYYSAGVNAVISEMTTLPEVISFAKVRASYAKVGNDVPSYITNPRDYAVNGTRNSVDQNITGPNPYKQLKPEDNRSFETGAEIRFMQDRIGIDFTYYKNNNYNQFVTSPAGKGADVNYSTWYWNLGNIQNSGIELSLTATPVKTGSLTWTTTVNYAANHNKIVDLSDEEAGLTKETWQVLNDFGVNMYGLFLREGGKWGDIYGNRKLKRDDQGRVVVNTTGVPVTEGVAVPQADYVGNPMPKFTLGWNNQVDYKNFSLSFLVDGRFGGKVISLTQAYLDFYGYSKASADARDAGGVDVPAVYEDGSTFEGKIDAQKYYTAIGNRSGVAKEYAYDATNVRLRELSLGYKLPVTIKGIRNVSISLVGRNLFFISRKAPFDPEITMSTGNTLQGIDVFGLPTTRSIGANLKVGF
jgi:TonB-linked SusC/RagA family outer membrane protein